MARLARVFTGSMDLVNSLDAIRFEWSGDRNVKLRIRDITLTFSTG
jgi:hypothetical protein